MTRFTAILAASCAALVLTPFAAAQATAPASAETAKPAAPAYAVPRTSFGHPSFEGVWTSNFILPLEASAQAPMLTLPEPAAKAMADAVANRIAEILDKQLDPEIPVLMKQTDGLAIVRGERRTRMVVAPADGKIPYTPEAKVEASRGQAMGAFNNPEERPNWERCVASMGRAPVAGTGESNPRQFVQTPTQVVIHTEYGSEARIIPFTDRHQPKMFHSALGDSIARWEGDTLVIETIGMSEKDRVRLFPTLIVAADAKVIERYTRLSDKELLYQFTVEDPKVYSAPWLAEFSIYRTDQRMFEHACHEGNYSIANILRGQRVKDERAAKKP
jgi:hypothetical protein